MKVKDFEKAADAIGVDIQEIKLQHGQVRVMLGSKRTSAGRLLIRWDSSGRAFSILPEKEDSTHEDWMEYEYKRDTLFDLKFT